MQESIVRLSFLLQPLYGYYVTATKILADIFLKKINQQSNSQICMQMPIL